MKNYKISFTPNIPLYYQIEAFFKFKIKNGELKPGDRIADERSICKVNKISLGTLRKAFDRLVSENLIIRKVGRGTFISDSLPFRHLPVEMKLIGYMEDLIMHGKNADVEVLEMTEKSANKDIAEFFEIDEGNTVSFFRRLKSVGGEPIYYVENYIVPDFGRKITRKDLTLHPPLEIFQKKFNENVDHIRQEISVTKADAEKASILSIDVFEPLMFITLFIYGNKSRPIGISNLYCRPDRYKFIADLTKSKTCT